MQDQINKSLRSKRLEGTGVAAPVPPIISPNKGKALMFWITPTEWAHIFIAAAIVAGIHFAWEAIKVRWKNGNLRS